MRTLTAMFLLSASALVVASGCSSKDEALGPETGLTTVAPASGARLRAKFITAGDTRELVGFYDSERKEDCTFQRAEDRRMRCLPKALPYARAGGFSDPGCTTALAAVAQSACAAAQYVLATSRDGCVETKTGLRKILDPASTRYAPGPNGCAPQAASAAAPNAVAVGDLIPWAAFVEAVETTGPPSGGVAETILTAPDGAKQHLGFRLEQLDAECTFQIMADGKTRCLPTGSTGPVLYADDACTKAAFVRHNRFANCAIEGADIWLDRPEGTPACSGIRAVYSLGSTPGSEDAPREVYGEQVRSTTTCTTQFFGGARGGSQSLRSIAQDLTASLPSADRVSHASGRLVRALVAKSGAEGLELGWHDNERDADCAFTLASDGKVRCLPTGATATIFSTDGACASPSHVAVLGQPQCDGATTRFARVLTTTCPPATRVYALGTERRDLPSASVETAPGRCASVAGVGNALDATEADPAQFVEGVPVTE